MANLRWHTRDVSARDTRMRVIETGRGPSLLLLHDFLMTRDAWLSCAERLARNYRVVIPDLPGFGESEKPSPTRFNYGIEAFSESIADLIAALDMGRTHVIGHGMSGAVAVTLAAEHSEFVNHLVVVDPQIYPVRKKAGIMGLPILGALYFKQLYGRSLFRKYFRERVFSMEAPFPHELVDTFYAKFNAPSARESAFATWHSLRDTRPSVARMSRVSVPTYIVWGRFDRLFPCQLGQRMAREIGAKRLDVMEAGHAPFIEKPELFCERVGEFFSATYDSL